MLDVHRAQKIERIFDRLFSLKTTPVYIPGGTTGLLQPLDVVVKAPFKIFSSSSSQTSIFTTILMTMFIVLFPSGVSK